MKQKIGLPGSASLLHYRRSQISEREMWGGGGARRGEKWGNANLATIKMTNPCCQAVGARRPRLLRESETLKCSGSFFKEDFWQRIHEGKKRRQEGEQVTEANGMEASAIA